VDIIVKEVQAMQGMVDEFSRFARMPRPQPAEVDLERLLLEIQHLYEGLKAGVRIESRIEPDAVTAWLDREQIKRALINLLDNAVEAVEAPGSVEISARKSNGLLRIDVADTGPGIPPAAKEKLFLPYFSTKGRGTGLGLSIVHRIVADHHGTIRVTENKPRGTIFCIELPQA
jgi:nitrogen fixation/metabolism regulation signal transduction histidine kinase